MKLILAVTLVQLPVNLLSAFTGSIAPLVTDLITKSGASSKVKSAVNLVLAVGVGVASAFLAHQGTLDVGQIVQAAITAYLAAGVTFSMLWKPQGVSDAIQNSTPNFGLGAAPVVPAGGPPPGVDPLT